MLGETFIDFMNSYFQNIEISGTPRQKHTKLRQLSKLDRLPGNLIKCFFLLYLSVSVTVTFFKMSVFLVFGIHRFTSKSHPARAGNGEEEMLDMLPN